MSAVTAQPATPRVMRGQWNSVVTSYYLVVGSSLLLLVIGIVMVLSSSSIDLIAAGKSPYLVAIDQSKFAVIGLVGAVVISRLPVRWIARSAWLLILGAMFGQLLTFIPGIGISVHGNRGWIRIAGQTGQPAEAAKLALAVWLGFVLSRKRALLHQPKHVLIPGGIVAMLSIGLVLGGKDLGTAMILILLVAGAMVMAGIPKRLLAAGATLAFFAAALMIRFSDNRVGRIKAWLDGVEGDPFGTGFQLKHGLRGLATGGWFGIGLGQSKEKWSYLPEAHNDFIFAIIGEELGLIGTLLVLGLFGLLAVAMMRVIRRHPDPFVKITTGAIATWIIGQALINIGVVVGLFPVIGVPLPLVSAGGSALIVTLLALGVVAAFARSEPGAAEALSGRIGVMRRSAAVIGRVRG